MSEFDHDHNTDAQAVALRAAIVALEAQRALLGDAAVDLAQAPLRAQLAALSAPRRLQRRQVTVMFADIVASTAMIQQLDPEDVVVVLTDMLARAEACVQAHGGRRLRFTGDGLKAAFGVDSQREDDPARAVRAALAILDAGRDHARHVRERYGVSDFAMRVGLHTGDVVFGAGIEDGDTLVGDAVHLAARMEQSAPANTVRLSRETWNHVRGLFDAEESPPLSVKGVEQPLRTYLVRGPRADAEVERGVEGVSAPMVGRQDDLQRLRASDRITVIGDAGLGKSRLLHEALALHRTELGAGRVLEARAQPDAGLRPWGLLWQMLAAHCGISDGDAVATVRLRVVSGLSRWLGDDGQAQSRLVGQLVGLDFTDDPQLRTLDARAVRDRALLALRSWLEALAAHDGAPPLLALQDLHWADEASLDWVRSLLVDPSPPLTLWCNARPELLERRPDWPAATVLRLAPLSTQAALTLVHRLLPGRDPWPASLYDDLVARAAGNPYFLEELVRRLLDDGIVREIEGGGWTFDADRLSRLRLPTTLVGLLQARLNALPEPERQAAQAASIVGHVFWDAAVGEINPGALATIPRLERRHWIKVQDHSAFDDTAERRFDHHLLHQVTYGTVIKDDRRQGHAAVARWLAQRTADRAPEFLAITGDHAERAGDLALAIDCFTRAGQEAQRRYANALAIECARRVLRLLPEEALDARRAQWLALALLGDLVGDQALQQQAIDNMTAIIAVQPDPAAEADLFVRQSLLADRQGRHLEARTFAERAVAAGQRAGAAADAPMALAYGELCWLHNRERQFDAARDCLRHGLAHARAASHTRPTYEVQLLLMEGVVAVAAGDPVLARRALEDALTLAEERAEPRVAIGALDHLCTVAVDTGDGPRAMALAERMHALAVSLGATPRIGHALRRMSESLHLLGDLPRARQVGEESREVATRVGDQFTLARVERRLALIHRTAGDHGAAHQAHERALAVHRALAPDGPDAWLMEAELALSEAHLGLTDAARQRIDRIRAAQARGVDFRSGEEPLQGWWALYQALDALGDPEAPGLLGQLDALARAEAVRLVGPDDEQVRQVLRRAPLLADIMTRVRSRSEHEPG